MLRDADAEKSVKISMARDEVAPTIDENEQTDQGKDSRLEFARQEIVELKVKQICICVNKKDYDTADNKQVKCIGISNKDFIKENFGVSWKWYERRRLRIDDDN